MSLVIWNKIEPAKISVVVGGNVLTIDINNVEYWSKPLTEVTNGMYNQLYDDIQIINEAYIRQNDEEFRELSDKFLEKLKVL